MFLELATLHYEVLGTQPHRMRNFSERRRSTSELESLVRSLADTLSITLVYAGGYPDKQLAAFKPFSDVPRISPLVGQMVAGLAGLKQAFAPLFSGPAKRHCRRYSHWYRRSPP
ncbi:unnamed protein product [Tuber aestivum]|uniref:Uncharacterized protein n=1 Tax=Tuber aestivum TaxID=59557 RepID=A0A292PXA5_9PEZI|nr:unnamed protein product [Tuber aestivum]